jgi:hypothetical protein
MVVLLMCVLVSAGCGRKPDDAALADTIKAKLFSDATLKGESIGITVNNGEATLVGDVSSDDARQRVVNLVQLVPGVTKVNDSLQVSPKSVAEPTFPPPASPSTPNSAQGLAPVPAAPPPTPPPAAVNTPAPINHAPAGNSPAAANVTPPAPAPAPAPAPPPPPKPRVVSIPQGTEVRVLTIDPIDSDKNKVGSTFLATLYSPITVGSEVVVPQNANVYIKLLNAASSGKFKGTSEIHIALDAVEVQGKRYPLQSTTYEEAGKSQGKQTAKKVGIGAAVGTAVGAIAGGGKGAAIGAGIGAGAGVATQAFKKGDKLQIPAETKIDFTLEQPVEITLPPAKSSK